MMKNKLLIISLLMAFLNNQYNIEFPDDLDWNKFNRLVEINSISGIIGYVIQQAKTDSVPLKIREKYSKEFFSTIAVTTMRDEEMKSLIALLNENGIDHLLFKGYIIKDLYTIPELRTFGDIDFAIRKESRKKCNDLLCRSGYRLLDDWEPVYSYEKSVEYYEVHTELLDSNLNEKRDYRSYFYGFWKHAQKKDEHTYVLEPEYHLIFLLMHIAKHIYGSGAGIRMYLDIAFYLHKYREAINWNHFQNEIEALKLSKFVNTVFTSIKEWFDVDSPVPLEKMEPGFMERFLLFTLNGGVFGFVDKSSALSQLRKSSNEGSVGRIKTLLYQVFPPVKYLKARYTYLQTKPWLLPAAWVHRYFLKKNTTAKFIHESKELISLDKSEVMKIKYLYDEIGL